jgi:hypothetical protein
MNIAAEVGSILSARRAPHVKALETPASKMGARGECLHITICVNIGETPAATADVPPIIRAVPKPSGDWVFDSARPR